ncbi:putative bifunctional diguanylate cyclase/phosphodiesterase [Paenibacillus harenae]|nr:EAL domain-containing protein [Paenibacillus harenae]
MGLAVCGMHYTGMSAAEFWCGDDELLMKLPREGADLVLLMIMMVTWIALYFDQTLLEKMAFSDPLTGLQNRHSMNHHFESKLGGSAHSALLFLDLDQFKLINDTLGHDIGDLLIKEVAARLQQFLGEDRYVFRLGGGDEFLLLAGEMSRQAVETMAQQILEDIRKVYILGGNELYITGSIGISYAPQHGTDRSGLLKAADSAMYHAKRLGKNQFCSFNSELEQKLIRRMEIEKGLRIALASGQFTLHYQPKWNAERNCPVGFEALLRWNHPKYGLVAPNEFIPIAEETGLIVGMTRWVLEQACSDCADWNKPAGGKLGVSVNLSINIFESMNLMDMIMAALQHASLPPDMLELEITESIVMKDAPEVIRQLLPLQEMGVTISMDNFGSGYSFLGAIDQIPFHTLKIDKHYMQESDSPSKRAIINTFITLANQLNLELVAEGVETERQLDFLRAAGCTIMQGYYFKKPMPRGELDRWLSDLNREAG